MGFDLTNVSFLPCDFVYKYNMSKKVRIFTNEKNTYCVKNGSKFFKLNYFIPENPILVNNINFAYLFQNIYLYFSISTIYEKLIINIEL